MHMFLYLVNLQKIHINRLSSDVCSILLKFLWFFLSSNVYKYLNMVLASSTQRSNLFGKAIIFAPKTRFNIVNI